MSESKISIDAQLWWTSMELSEQENIEKEFGYYGHDIGTTVQDIIYFYTEKFINKNAD
jgi:hypothetical protein